MPILGEVQPNARTATGPRKLALGAKDLNSTPFNQKSNNILKSDQKQNILKPDAKQNILKTDHKQKDERSTTRPPKPDSENLLKRSASTARRARKNEKTGELVAKLATGRMGTIGAGHSRRHSVQAPVTRPAVQDPEVSWDALAAQLEEQFNIQDEIETKAIESMNEGHSLPPFPATTTPPALLEQREAHTLSQSQKTPPKVRLRPLLLPTKHRVSSSLSVPRSSAPTAPETPRRETQNTPSPSPSPQKRKLPSPMRPVIRYSPKSMRWVNLRNPDRPVPASIIVGKSMERDPSNLESTPTKTSSRRALLKRDVINPGSPMTALMSSAIQPQAVSIPADLVPFIGKKAAAAPAPAVATPAPAPIAQDFAEFLQKAKVVSEAGSENGDAAVKRKRKRGKKVKAPLPPAEPEVLDMELLKKKFTSPPDETLAKLQAEMAESERTKDLDTRNSLNRLGASATPGVMDYRR